MHLAYLNKFVFILFFTIILPIKTVVAMPDKTLLFEKKEVSLQTIFSKIESINYVISFSNSKVNTQQTIILPQTSVSLKALLNYLEKEENIFSKITQKKIIFTQKKVFFTVTGFIKDSDSKETLIGANLKIRNTQYGTYSNAFGFYSISLPKGVYNIEISYIGYKSLKKQLNITSSSDANFYLQSNLNELSDIIVTPQKEKKTTHEEINLQQTQKQAQLFGNDDILKRLQFLAGVSGGNDGFSNLLVRGGDSNENLVLLDGVPVYNYNHFPGLLSIFNTQALKKVDVYKGLFPARYGGKLSSVLDIKMREGDMEKYHIGCSVDLSIFSLYAEGPIIKKKSSFLLSIRRSWIDFISSLLSKDNDEIGFHIWDINTKMNYILDKRNRFYISLYSGDDKFKSYDENIDALSWGNNILALRWNHILSDKIFLNTNMSFSRFKNTLYTEDDISTSERKYSYKLSEMSIGTDLEFYGNQYHLKAGTKFKHLSFEIPYLIPFEQNFQHTHSTIWNSYIENNIKFTKTFKANIGLNYVLYTHSHKSENFFQPRLSLDCNINPNHRFSLGFSEMQQFTHHLGHNSISIPYAFRMPSSNHFPASNSKLYEFNYIACLRNNKDSFLLSLYYKRQQNILAYRPHQKILLEQLARNWENQVTQGNKKGVGLEASYTTNLNPFYLNISYTFSDMKSRYKAINKGQYYTPSLNIKHQIKTNITYNFGKQKMHSLSFSYYYNSGQYISVPIYSINPFLKEHNEILIANTINNYQLNDSFQLDIGYTFKKGKSHIFKAGVFSLFGEPAPFYVSPYYQEDKLKIQKVALPSPLPYISYTFKF